MLTLISCTSDNSRQSLDQDPIIAAVESRELLTSTVAQALHSYASHEDSMALSTAYVDKWVRDQLMMREALQRYAADEEVNRLVDDYKGRLLMHHLESAVVEERFDTIITGDELVQYYEEVKTQFKLNEPIVRCSYVKFDRATKSLSEFYNDWKANKEHAVRTFAAAYGEDVAMDTSIWRPMSELKGWYSGFSERVVMQKRPQRQLDTRSQYYLKVADVIDKGEFSPLAYIRPQLERMLLHQRRQMIIDQYKQELYDQALRRGVLKL